MKRIHSHSLEDLKELQIDLLAGRPERDTIISKDEMLDLNIVLNTTEDVLDFLDTIS